MLPSPPKAELKPVPLCWSKMAVANKIEIMIWAIFRIISVCDDDFDRVTK